MYLVRPNWLMRKTYSSAIWRIPTKEKKIFLTFDDGPIPEITPWVLSVLKEYNAKATFFCVGANIEKHPNVFRQIISEGHSIGNHTFNHLSGWNTKTKEYLENVNLWRSAFEKEIHNPTFTTPKFFRPPYGKIKRSQLSRLNKYYSVVMWDVLSGDFDKKTSEEKCLQNVLLKTRQGSIVVFHDNIKAKMNLFYALPKFLDHFSKKDFIFAPLT